MAKTKPEGKLKQFVRQYKRKMIGGYLYIECPNPHFSYIKSVNWIPRPDVLIDVQDGVTKEGPHQTLGCVFSRKDNVWYIVSHIWVGMLPTWAPKEMRMYMEEVHSCMVKSFLEELVASMTKVYPPLNIYPTQEVEEKYDVDSNAMLFPIQDISKAGELVLKESISSFLDKIKQEVLDEEAKPKEEVQPKGWIHTVDKIKELRKLKQLEINIEQTEDERYMQVLGISKTTYDAMVADGAGVLAFPFAADGLIFVLDFMKVLQQKYQTKMSELYKAMREKDIITQDMKADNWRYNIKMSKSSIKSGYGKTYHDEEKNYHYPRFTRKGITAVLLMLAKEGFIPQTVIAYS